MKNILQKNLNIVLLSALLGSSAYAAKPKLEGFVLRGDPVSGAPGKRSHFDNPRGSDWAAYVDGIVVTAEWADLQEKKDGKIKNRNIIDQAIRAVSKYNERHDKEDWIYIKLRILSGIYSPKWVGKSVGKMKVDFKNAKQGDLPYFWTSKFQTHWKKFQNKLAKKYDNESLILDVALSGCMTHNAETMWRNYGTTNDTSIEDLKRKGLTQDADEACLLNQIDIAENAWKKTNISMAINGWKAYDLPKIKGKYQNKVSFANEMVKHCKDLLGKRCIVGNNSVGLDTATSNEHTKSDKALQYVAGYSNDTYVQTQTKAEEIYTAINYATNRLHATMAELPRLRDMKKVSEDFLSSALMQDARKKLKSKNASTDKTNKYLVNVTNMFKVNNTRAYAIRADGKYSRYSLSTDRGDYVLNIQGMWPEALEENYMNITGSFLARNGTNYIFMKDGTYYRYYYTSNSVQGPFNTSSAWPGISQEDAENITAVLPWKNGKIIYFILNNGQYIKYNWNQDKVIHKVNIEGNWPSTFSKYANDITGAINWNNDIGYIFLTGDRYLKYYFNSDYVTSPRKTSKLWPKLISDK